jgi:hypothetical protein
MKAPICTELRTNPRDPRAEAHKDYGICGEGIPPEGQ